MIRDKQKIRGHIRLKLFDEYGNLKKEYEHQNTITDTMDDLVANMMDAADSPSIGWMAVGTVNGGKTTASTQLEGLIAGSNNALDSTVATNNDVVYVCTWAAGDGTGTIIEAGLFNVSACTSGMCAYDESMNIVKGAADTLEITWTVTFGAS